MDPIVILGCGLLLILGGLIGHAMSEQLLEHRIRRQAVIRKEVGERWRILQQNSGGCRCSGRPRG